MSVGRRSDVPWMRLKLPSIDRAIDLASIVFPTPGTSSTRRCCAPNSATAAISTAWCLPVMTCSMLVTSALIAPVVCWRSIPSEYRRFEPLSLGSRQVGVGQDQAFLAFVVEPDDDLCVLAGADHLH